MENSFVFSFKVKKCKQKLKSFLNMKVDNEVQQATSSSSTENAKAGVDLPKLVLKKFSGDPLKWNPFRETYEAAINQNTRISNVQKLSYLIN